LLGFYRAGKGACAESRRIVWDGADSRDEEIATIVSVQVNNCRVYPPLGIYLSNSPVSGSSLSGRGGSAVKRVSFMIATVLANIASLKFPITLIESSRARRNNDQKIYLC
jgi:hypothetical protein